MSTWAHAFRLSASEVKQEQPPGTVLLIEHESHEQAHGDRIHLVPQPSDSPRDPLNFPAWRKYAVLFTMSFYAGVTSLGAAGLAPALVFLQFQMLPPQPLWELIHLIAVNVLMQGASNIIWVPLSHIFGRRVILILAMLIGVLSSVWGGLATSFSSLLAARAFQGLGFGPADTIAPNVIADVYFVHERGRAMTIYTLFLAAGSFVGAIVGSYIAAALGYQYIFWITTALLAFCLICQILLVPETVFDRDSSISRERQARAYVEKGDIITREEHITLPTSPQPDFTFTQSLSVGTYRGKIISSFVAPWRSLLLPGTWVISLQYGGLLGGTVAISTVGPQILAAPPYLWAENVGLLAVGGTIGCVLGGVTNYLVIDRLLIKNAKKKTSGLAEPETRLPAMFPALFLSATGLWVFGFCAANPSKNAWVGLSVGFGMIGFGLMQVPSIGFNYLIDAYGAASTDCFVMTTIVRAVVSFAWTFFVGQWVESAGPALPFGIFGVLMFVAGLLIVPLWMFGKRLRIATADRLAAIIAA